MGAAIGIERAVVGRQRKQNADAESVRFSERDGRLLGLVGEQYAISVEQLARLIGRTHRTGRWLRDRWRHAGWVESRPLTHNGPSFLWLTNTGVRIAQSPYRVWRPNVGLACHIEAVTDVRLLLEQEFRLGEWVCERALARGADSRSGTRPHLPDAVILRDDEEVAIEVELTLKSRARVEQIIDGLGERYTEVWYFVAAPLVPTLSRLAAEAAWQNVRVHGYPPRASELLP